MNDNIFNLPARTAPVRELTCKTCGFSEDARLPGQIMPVKICRFHPPQVVLLGQQLTAMFPVVSDDTWCHSGKLAPSAPIATD